MAKKDITLFNQNVKYENRLYLAFELSNSKWKLIFSNGERLRHKTINAGDKVALNREIEKAKEKLRFKEDVKILSCYEAGRDGFWIHRYLSNQGIENIVVDSSSIEVNRRKRRAKTDRIDAGALMRMLIRYYAGEKKVWSVVRVPSIEEEDARQLHREIDTLKNERTRHGNRIKGLLVTQGIRLAINSCFIARLEVAVTGDGYSFPPELRDRIKREYERYKIVDTKLKELRKRQLERIKKADTPSHRKIGSLMELCGIGHRSAWVFVMEFLGWRNFKNRREIAALAGLTPTPYQSGEMRREQGISKAGNRRIRALIVEISWLWLRFQPESRLSKWYQERFAKGGKRMRRIGIVALARKLLIALWQFLEKGVIDEGAKVSQKGKNKAFLKSYENIGMAPSGEGAVAN